MYNLNSYAESCKSMLDHIGIEYGKIQSVQSNSRFTSTWGRCNRNGDTFTIYINSVLLNEENPIDGLINTLIHEILHTCKGCFNHGEAWKRQAAKVKAAYGIDIKRCSSAAEKGIQQMEKTYKYAVRCPDCGYTWYYQKMCETVKNPGRYHHSGCVGKLERVY